MSTSLKDLAYTFIRRKLLEGRIPPGTRLSSRALAREIGVSFIPVREAITQLAAEGLVEHEPGIGTFSARVDVNDLVELYILREALEVHAIGLTAQLITGEQLAEVENWNDQLRELAAARAQSLDARASDADLRTWIHADLELHLTLLRAGGNKRLLRAVKDLRQHAQVFKAQRVLGPAEDLARACQHHEQLIRALERRDAARARTLMSEHIRFACKNALEYLALSRVQA